MNAENIRDRYMALVADREAVFAFHSSIPAAQSDEETAERLRRCYARLSSLLEADSAKGDAKAQFVLGHLLTKGHEIYLQLRVTAEGRPSRSYRRGLDWLIRADRQGLSEATEELVEITEFPTSDSIDE